MTTILKGLLPQSSNAEVVEHDGEFILILVIQHKSDLADAVLVHYAAKVEEEEDATVPSARFEEMISLVKCLEEKVEGLQLKHDAKVEREIVSSSKNTQDDEETANLAPISVTAPPEIQKTDHMEAAKNTKGKNRQESALSLNEPEAVASGDNPDKENERNEESLLPQDTFSFFAIASDFNWKRPSPSFLIAVTIFILQIFTLSLLAVDVVDLNHEKNPLGIPPGVEFPVRMSQFIALFITIISQSEVLESLNVLYRGYDEFESSVCYDPAWSWWCVSAATRLATGCLSISVTCMLTMRADTVRDLLLNFTAVEFISSVDDMMFLLSKRGYLTWSRCRYFGNRIKEDAKKVVDSTRSENEEENGATKFPRFLCLLAMFLIMFGFWVWIAVRQNQGDFLFQTIYAQFGDEFSPALGTVHN